MKVTTFRLNEEDLTELSAVAKLLKKEKSEVIRQAVTLGLAEIRLELAIDGYVQGKVSIGRAAELAKVSLIEFHRELKKRGITIRYGEEKLEEELKALSLT